MGVLDTCLASLTMKDEYELAHTALQVVHHTKYYLGLLVTTLRPAGAPVLADQVPPAGARAQGAGRPGLGGPRTHRRGGRGVVHPG